MVNTPLSALHISCTQSLSPASFPLSPPCLLCPKNTFQSFTVFYSQSVGVLIASLCHSVKESLLITHSCSVTSIKMWQVRHVMTETGAKGNKRKDLLNKSWITLSRYLIFQNIFAQQNKKKYKLLRCIFSIYIFKKTKASSKTTLTNFKELVRFLSLEISGALQLQNHF